MFHWRDGLQKRVDHRRPWCRRSPSNNVGDRLFPHGIDKAFDSRRDMGNDPYLSLLKYSPPLRGVLWQHVSVCIPASRSEVGAICSDPVDKAVYNAPGPGAGACAVPFITNTSQLIGAHGAGVHIDIRAPASGRHPQIRSASGRLLRGRRDALCPPGRTPRRPSQKYTFITRFCLSLSFFPPRARAPNRALLSGCGLKTSTVPGTPSTALFVISARYHPCNG